MSVPFHKQTDPNKQAGQIVFSPSVTNTSEQYLHQYIARKTDVVNVAFTKWFEEYNKKHGLPPAHIIALAAWEAALNNGKVS